MLTAPLAVSLTDLSTVPLVCRSASAARLDDILGDVMRMGVYDAMFGEGYIASVEAFYKDRVEAVLQMESVSNLLQVVAMDVQRETELAAAIHVTTSHSVINKAVIQPGLLNSLTQFKKFISLLFDADRTLGACLSL